MLSRRDVVVGGLMAGTSAMLSSVVADAVAPLPRTKVNFDVPPGATDCAVHVFGDQKRHPYWEGARTRPEPPLSRARRFLQPFTLPGRRCSGDSLWNRKSCVIDSLRELGNRGRGVAISTNTCRKPRSTQCPRAGVAAFVSTLAIGGNRYGCCPAAAEDRGEERKKESEKMEYRSVGPGPSRRCAQS